MRQTVKDVSNKYESLFFIPWPPVNFNINRGDFLLKIRFGPWGGPWTGVHGSGSWGGPWTRSMGWSMDPGPCFVYVRIHSRGLLFGKRLDTILPRHRVQKLNIWIRRPHVIGFFTDLFLSTLESGFRNIRIRCWFRWMRVDGSRIRSERKTSRI